VGGGGVWGEFLARLKEATGLRAEEVRIEAVTPKCGSAYYMQIKQHTHLPLI
jgi:hypothetical protein